MNVQLSLVVYVEPRQHTVFFLKKARDILHLMSYSMFCIVILFQQEKETKLSLESLILTAPMTGVGFISWKWGVFMIVLNHADLVVSADDT